MMGLVAAADDHNEPRSTPKLSLSKLPCKPKHSIIQMLTPPLQPSVSVPFQWEEAPGKPRSSTEEEEEPPPPPTSKSRAVRCLHLPPRLSHEDHPKVTMPSPTVVLDGPYVGRSTSSLACTFSFRRGPGSGGLRPAKKGGCGSFGRSRRWRSWGSFRFGGDEKEEEVVVGRGSFDLSQSSLGDFFKREKNVKTTTLRRVRSFFHLSTFDSSLLEIYARLKHAIPWRRRR